MLVQLTVASKPPMSAICDKNGRQVTLNHRRLQE
jgi:hypothetical protein